MGVRTLEEFREDLSKVLGNRGGSNRWYDRRINAAYIDVATAILHEALRHCATLTVDTEEEDAEGNITGGTVYGVGEDVIGIVSVVDNENDRVLVNTENENLDHYKEKEGAPRLWARQGSSVRLWPEPDEEYTLDITYYREPDHLEDDDDVTILEARWDQAIHLMASHYGLMDLGDSGEASRSTEYLQRAMAYMSARLTDSDIRRSPTMPVTVPSTMRELTKMRNSL